MIVNTALITPLLSSLCSVPGCCNEPDRPAKRQFVEVSEVAGGPHSCRGSSRKLNLGGRN